MSSKGRLQGALGWGLLTVLFALSGAFSTVLNGLQTLNGLFCFVTVSYDTILRENDVASFTISGYGDKHYHVINEACRDVNLFMDTGGGSSFCYSTINYTPQQNSTDNSTYYTNQTLGFRCGESAIGRRGDGMHSFSYTLDVSCLTNQTSSSGPSFMLSLTPGSSSMVGVSSSASLTSFQTTGVVHVDRCSLSRYFYIVFSSICVAITGTILIIRAAMRTCSANLTFKLSNSVRFYWVYMVLQKYEFFSFNNPYMNEPYHLMKGEKFYAMRDRSPGSLKGEVQYDAEFGGQRGVEFVESLAWSSSNSVYKFTFDNGEVYAYSKDNSGFETFIEANVETSVASVIKEYLKLKSQAACITNDRKSHFLSLTDCCNLAKEGHRLVEGISDGNYKLYGRKQINLTSKVFNRGFSRLTSN